MTYHRRLTILTIILIGYLAIAVAVAGLGWFTTDSMQRLRTITEDLYRHPYAVSNAAANLKGSLFELRNKMVQIVLIRNSADDLAALEHELQEYERQAKSDLAVIRANFLGDMTRVMQFETTFTQWNDIRERILAANRAGDLAQAERLIKEVGTPTFNEMVPLIDYVSTFASNKAKSFFEQAHATSQQMVSRVLDLVMLVTVFVGGTALVVWWRVRFLQRELDRRATLDTLTGIPNRRHFLELANRELERAKRYQSQFALAVVDLDWFKKINDTYGHHVGDEVLRQFCVICRQTLRDSDMLGRLGGEEFAILFPSTRLADALEVLERVRIAVWQSAPAGQQAPNLKLTASFGLAAFRLDIADLKDMLIQADKALYQAKENGRNQICALPS